MNLQGASLFLPDIYGQLPLGLLTEFIHGSTSLLEANIGSALAVLKWNIVQGKQKSRGPTFLIIWIFSSTGNSGNRSNIVISRRKEDWFPSIQRFLAFAFVLSIDFGVSGTALLKKPGNKEHGIVRETAPAPVVSNTEITARGWTSPTRQRNKIGGITGLFP